jgi:two-component sensor histidine kinase
MDAFECESPSAAMLNRASFGSADSSPKAAPDEGRWPALVETRISWIEIGLVVSAWVVILAVPMASLLTGSCCGGEDQPQAAMIVATLIANTLPWIVVTIPVFWLCRQLHPDDRGWGRTLMGHLIMAFVVLYAAEMGKNVALASVQASFDVERHIQPFTTNPVEVLTSLSFLGSLPPYLLLVLVGLGRDAYLRYRDRRDQAEQLERETEQLRAQLTEARLQTLRMQINPHFLFNTLHTVSTMAGRDPEGIRRAIARLSEMLRYALSTSDRQEVPLDEEIEFLNSYLAIQKLRLDERLDVTLDVEPGVRQALVPTLLLQPLAENAVKHGFEGTDETGHLTVRAHRDGDVLVLQVIDDGRGLDDSSALPAMNTMLNGEADGEPGKADQHGLHNIATRLRGLYGTAADWTFAPSDSGGLHVTLRLPFHTRTADRSLRLSGVVAE